MKSKNLILSFTVLLLCLVLNETAIGQNTPLPTELQREFESIEDTVLSPYCPGRLLRDCPSSKASELKQSIRADLTEGRSREEIINELYEEFGEEIRGSPTAQGFGLLAWVAPFLFLLIGGLILFRFLKTSVKTPNP